MEIYRPFLSVPPLQVTETNEHFVPYVFVEKLFNDTEVDLLNGLWNEDEAKEGGVGKENRLSPEKRKARELFIKADNNEWIYDKIGSIVLLMNAAKFKLDITGFKGPLRMLKYETGDFFNWHMDYGAGESSNRKIVACIQLSDEKEYEGGELQLMTDKIQAPKKKGSAAIFPCYLLHRVAPVISGCRKSLIALIAGPPYK